MFALSISFATGSRGSRAEASAASTSKMLMTSA
jgi:hypothetical protein